MIENLAKRDLCLGLDNCAYKIKKRRFTLNRFLAMAVALVFSLAVAADDREPGGLWGSTLYQQWQSNLRWTVDLSSRRIFQRQDSFAKNVVGFDLHKVISTADRDIGTLIFQPYIVNLSGSDTQPFFFDGRDTELTWRITNFNYIALSNGSLNIRAGHFEIPFGLEQNIGTNGTLRQYSFAERGIKTDWGVSINGVLPRWDYEISLTRGSGNDINDRGNPYIFAGRIGSAAHKNFVFGVSFFDGEVLGEIANTRRQRVGFDITKYLNDWQLLAEFSAGEDDDASRALALLEASWRSNDESLHLYSQFSQRRIELENVKDSGSVLTFGGRIRLWSSLLVSGQWSKAVNSLGAQNNASEFTLQIRYRL